MARMTRKWVVTFVARSGWRLCRWTSCVLVVWLILCLINKRSTWHCCLVYAAVKMTAPKAYRRWIDKIPAGVKKKKKRCDLCREPAHRVARVREKSTAKFDCECRLRVQTQAVTENTVSSVGAGTKPKTVQNTEVTVWTKCFTGRIQNKDFAVILLN